jgi:diadenosine tetraphosphate (Ap4A) HIT family hydrolase
MPGAGCELCDTTGGTLLWQGELCRVVEADMPGYAGFCRVIWNAHVKEMTDLRAADRAHLMEVVFAVETTLREVMAPHKVNLASLGNLTPHLHWHVIPRYLDDPHFPLPIWAGQQRAAPHTAVVELASRLAPALRARICHTR